MRFLFIASTLLLLLSSCQERPQAESEYFAIDSLLDAQIALLRANKATLTKTAKIDGISDEQTAVPDSTGWAHELEIFRHLDVINKPTYRNSYAISDGDHDTRSNLIIRSFVSHSDTPVQRLSLFYLGGVSDIKRIEAITHERNTLYATRRELKMEFEEMSGMPVLVAYSIEGAQKMILSDSVHFLITSKIILNN